MSEGKFVIQNTDMSEDMQQEVTEYAAQALEKYYRQQDIASYMKREFDTKYDPAWHCFVGRKFGCYVTHKSKHFIYFYLGQLAILLFKSA
ncbi:dynein light chain 2, cytoplasmic-like [Narcine bancroftii]|uniref:dynein light chain 2, cytoplasmic-like n=1 Tax=Narcine bancroftii TaxID=1343680 RepID=UPI0038316D06